jgi:hypothetical protein
VPNLLIGEQYFYGMWFKAFDAADVGKVVAYRGVAGASYGKVTLTNQWQLVGRAEVAALSSVGVSIAIRGNEATADSVSFLVAHAQLEIGAARTEQEEKADASYGASETFRGNKRAFPRLAAIVAEDANVTIYDLTESGRPMVLRWATGANNMVQGTISSVGALNGYLCVGSNSGLFVINMVKDSAAFQSTSTDKTYKGGIALRGGANGYA